MKRMLGTIYFYYTYLHTKYQRGYSTLFFEKEGATLSLHAV